MGLLFRLRINVRIKISPERVKAQPFWGMQPQVFSARHLLSDHQPYSDITEGSRVINVRCALSSQGSGLCDCNFSLASRLKNDN